MVKLIITLYSNCLNIDGLETIHRKFSHCNKSRRRRGNPSWSWNISSHKNRIWSLILPRGN